MSYLKGLTEHITNKTIDFSKGCTITVFEFQELFAEMKATAVEPIYSSEVAPHLHSWFFWKNDPPGYFPRNIVLHGVVIRWKYP